MTAMLALAFAPISLFFLITAHNYPFFKLLNVAILVLTALVGLRFLTGGMGAQRAPACSLPAAAAPAGPLRSRPSRPVGARHRRRAGRGRRGRNGRRGLGRVRSPMPVRPPVRARRPAASSRARPAPDAAAGRSSGRRA